MKTFMRWLRATRLAVLVLLFLFCCSDPEEEEITPSEEVEGEEITPDDADALLKTFSFTINTEVRGNVPTVVNTALVKTNSRDTIYVLPEIKNLIRISHPESRPVKGIYFAARGSTFYYDVPIYEKEDSDTVSVILFEIDPEDIDAPYDIPVEITPYDDNNQPIDIIERIITVEKPSNDLCDILQSGDTANINLLHGWEWYWTMLLNRNDEPALINGPGRIFSVTQKYSGCCDESACPAYVVDPNTQIGKWVYDSEFDAGTSYGIISEFFEFYTNGTFSRHTAEQQLSVDAEGTDWCTGVPAVTSYIDEVYYYGTHDYTPGNTGISYATTHSTCNDPLGLCGYGSRGGQLTFSCHTMIITVGNESQKEIRMYIRTYDSNTETGGDTGEGWGD